MSDMGICSRRKAEQLISRGRIKLNGRPVNIGDKMDMGRDLLSVDGITYHPSGKREYSYYMLYKPRGYITTTSDDKGRKTVMDLLGDIPVRVYPVGRLDKDSEGLLLLTDDGELANALTHPSHSVPKTYRVTVKPGATEEQISSISRGYLLGNGKRSRPAKVMPVLGDENRTVLEITLKEGKNREIRRLCESVGLEVARLVRKSEGPIKLGMLRPGKYRPLEKGEIKALKDSAGLKSR